MLTLEQAWLERCRLTGDAAKFRDEADKLNAEYNKLRAQIGKSWAEGDKIWAETGKLRAETHKLWAMDDQLRAEAAKLRAEVDKLRAEAHKLCAEADLIWSSAVLEHCGPWGLWPPNRMIPTLEELNLDSLDREDLNQVIVALVELTDYAKLRAGAMYAKASGDMDTSLRLESECDKSYRKLPRNWRWYARSVFRQA